MAWILVLIAAALEIVWASGLKYASTPMEWVGIFALITISYVLLIQTYKKLPVAIAYTVFVGIGTIGTYIIGISLGEPYSLPQIAFLIILLVGIIGMKLSTKDKEEA
ncbi:DMT family transporter [Paenibacillus marinisediminis]